MRLPGGFPVARWRAFLINRKNQDFGRWKEAEGGAGAGRSVFRPYGAGRSRPAQSGAVEPALDVSSDYAVRLPALPRVPLLILFHQADAEFAAACSLFFEQRARQFLDAESLAIPGWLVVAMLQKRLLEGPPS